MSLRKYQSDAVEATWNGLYDGNVLVEVPTAGGKSHIIAGFIHKALQAFPDTKILMLVHRKELVMQNAEKMEAMLDGEHEVAVYCAALKRKEIGQVTFASVQSLARSKNIPEFDIVIVDECHRIPKSAYGQYHSTMDRTGGRCIGFTATPYRLQGGIIHGKDQLFPKVTYRVSVNQLLKLGFLCPIVGFKGKGDADLSNVKKGSDGDYKKGELANAYEDPELVSTAVKDIMSKAHDRKSIIIFAAGIEHAEMICCELYEAHGELPVMITGETDHTERAEEIDKFKAGETRFLINVGVFTEGFDSPNVDCVVLLRATLSPGLYVQMVGRGMRLFDGKADCLLLDFGGNVIRHGPINNVCPPANAREKAPVTTRVCPMCETFVPIRLKICTCGFEFPPGEFEAQAKHSGFAGLADPLDPKNLKRWRPVDIEYRKHKKAGKPACLMVAYSGGLAGSRKVNEFVCIEHSGRARIEARRWLARRGIMPNMMESVEDIIAEIETAGILEPMELITNHVGKWPELVDVVFKRGAEKVRKRGGIYPTKSKTISVGKLFAK